MNKANCGEKYGITQYARAHSYELAGKTLMYTDDTGNNYVLEFIDKTTVNYTKNDVSEMSQYEAQKINASVFLVSFGLVFRAAVIDIKNGIAVFTNDVAGEFVFCKASNCTGNLPTETEDMTGTFVKWVFGYNRYLLNTYLEDKKCKCVWSPREDRPRTIPATYIKVGEGLYLVELNSTSPFYTDFTQGFSRMLMLQDYDRMSFIGAFHSPATNETIMVSGYGLDPLAN